MSDDWWIRGRMRIAWFRTVLPLCLLLLLVGARSYGQSGFVRADGRYLVTPAKQRLLLRGTNLGNWLEPEGYMFRFGDNGPTSPREIEDYFDELIGPQQRKDVLATIPRRIHHEGRYRPAAIDRHEFGTRPDSLQILYRGE